MSEPTHDDLDDDLASLYHAERAHPGPPRASKERVRAAVLATAALAGTAATGAAATGAAAASGGIATSGAAVGSGAALASSVSAPFMAVAAVVVAAAVVVGVVRDDEPAPIIDDVAVVDTSAHHASAPVVEHVVAEEVAEEVAPEVEEEIVEPVVEVKPVRRTTQAKPPPPEPPPPVPPPPTTTPEERASRLAAERALIGAARVSLKSGDAASCLSSLEEHRAQFKDALLAEEREALVVMCFARGGDASARAKAEAFFATYPNSVHKQAVRAAVGLP